LLGHLHLQSPFKALLDKSPVKCRVIFNCADCYISPTVYKKKELTGEVVPTWNYVAAQLKGEMKLVNDKQEFR
jgi:transcriptional regulator